jgi:hypothetical protein
MERPVNATGQVKKNSAESRRNGIFHVGLLSGCVPEVTGTEVFAALARGSALRPTGSGGHTVFSFAAKTRPSSHEKEIRGKVVLAS